MSEAIKPQSGEQVGHRAPEKRPEAQVEHPSRHEQPARHEHVEALDKIKLEIEQEATSGEGLKDKLETGSKQEEQPRFFNKELRRKALKDVLSRTRHHLNKPEKSLSKVIHQPAVEAVSAMAANTIARPSGLLTAGVAALVGGLGLLYVSRHYGYEYRFSAYVLLLGAGFLAGILIELLIKLLRRR